MATVPVGVSSRGRMFEIISCVFASLSFVAVVLRLIARWTSLRKFLTDDYICIAAQVFYFGLMVNAIIFTQSCGMGWHVTQVPVAQVEKFFKVFYSAELLYGIVTALYKLAVIFLYRNIFNDSRGFNIASGAMAALSIAWWISGFFASLLQCTPIARAWNPALPGTCVDKEAYILGLGISNLFIDVFILLLPLPMIWKLNLSGRKKLGLMGMFLLGSVVCVASIFRLTTLVPLRLADPTYTLFDVAVWSEIEPAVGIIAACLPTLRQYFFHCIGDRSKSRPGYSYGYGDSRSNQKSQLASTNDKDNIAITLSNWTNARYEDVESSISSNDRTPRRQSEGDPVVSTSFADADPTVRLTDRDSKTIVVKREATVEYTGRK